MLIAHILGLPAEELLEPMTSGAFGAAAVMLAATVMSLARRLRH
ncbi:MAG TPA: hypothetical protein VFU90_04435 [Candidatus Tumulicola sp.]|nr:hypothetical protein [Candidatus Tumulicola sp.]